MWRSGENRRQERSLFPEWLGIGLGEGLRRVCSKPKGREERERNLVKIRSRESSKLYSKTGQSVQMSSYPFMTGGLESPWPACSWTNKNRLTNISSCLLGRSSLQALAETQLYIFLYPLLLLPFRVTGFIKSDTAIATCYTSTNTTKQTGLGGGASL